MRHPHFETFRQRDRLAFIEEVKREIERDEADRKVTEGRRILEAH
jgi:hypothetical protein